MSRHLCRQGRFFIIVLPIRADCARTRKKERDEMSPEQRRKYERGKRKRTVSESLRSSRETNLLASLPADGAHILISTRSPSYYWLKINRPFRG